MCRFLIVSSKNIINPAEILNEFASACEKSIAPDGEGQSDGFGVAFKNSGKWQTKKSVQPIWQERELLNQIPETDLLMAHARSATFSLGKDNLDYNQPFTDGELGFVFNGTIKKMKTALKLKGEIGSQKLFSLIKLFLKNNPEEKILEKIRDFILAKAESIEGMNIGLVNQKNISALCQYAGNAEYFTLHFFERNDLLIISSEKFGNFNWLNMQKGEVKNFYIK